MKGTRETNIYGDPIGFRKKTVLSLTLIAAVGIIAALILFLLIVYIVA